MGKCQSQRKDNLNNSIPVKYVLEKNDEILLTECEDNRINFVRKTENFGNGIIKTSEISNGIIRRQTYRRKTDSKIYKEEIKKEQIERKKLEEIEKKEKILKIV